MVPFHALDSFAGEGVGPERCQLGTCASQFTVEAAATGGRATLALEGSLGGQVWTELGRLDVTPDGPSIANIGGGPLVAWLRVTVVEREDGTTVNAWIGSQAQPEPGFQSVR